MRHCSPHTFLTVNIIIRHHPTLLLLHTTILLFFSFSSAVALVSLRASSSLSSRLWSWLSSCRCWKLAFVLSSLFSVARSCLARLSRQERVSWSIFFRTRVSLSCLVRIWVQGQHQDNVIGNLLGVRHELEKHLLKQISKRIVKILHCKYESIISKCTKCVNVFILQESVF